MDRTHRTRPTPTLVSLCLLGALASLAGCGAGDDLDGAGAVASTSGALVVPDFTAPPTVTAGDTPPPGNPEVSTVTFFSEAAFGGDALTRSVTPPARGEASTLVTFDMIDGAGLTSRISSVRLVCGNHASQLMLFDFPNTGPLEHWWNSGPTFVLECAPNQIVFANLHTQAPALADRVGSAHLLAHASKAASIIFSAAVAAVWNKQPLPEGATAPTGVELQMIGDNGFLARQDLVLDATACGEHDADLTIEALMKPDRTFMVFVKETNVSSGTGDTWGCRDEMKKRLAKAAVNTAHVLEPKLNAMMAIAGNHPIVYFVPFEGLRVFMLGAGGDLPAMGMAPGVVGTASLVK